MGKNKEIAARYNFAAISYYLSPQGNAYWLIYDFAEDEGFKPPIPERGIPDFESSAIDHSANLPNAVQR